MPQLRTEDVTWQALDEEIVVLDLRSSSYMRLNRTAATLWRLLARATSQEALETALVEEHGASEDQAARDTSAFLDDLRRRGLLIDDE